MLVNVATAIDLPKAKADCIPASNRRVHLSQIYPVDVEAQQRTLPVLYHARGPAEARVAVTHRVEHRQPQALACIHLEAHVDVPPQLGNHLIGNALHGFASPVCVISSLMAHVPDAFRGGLEAIPHQDPPLNVKGPLDHSNVRLPSVPCLIAELLVALLESLRLEAGAQLVEELADRDGRRPHDQGLAFTESLHAFGPRRQPLRTVLEPRGDDGGQLCQSCC
mmetsp:Transcript_94928/g.277567  ORF Transcript_94928/g.277567 Transcript_94928/m.277567 type:complete len:222 (-) Transcript_94928:1271-1936(-)